MLIQCTRQTMASYRDILNFEVIQEFVKKLTGSTIDEDLKETGFKEFEEKYSNDEIYEEEATEIEQELIKIYLGDLSQDSIFHRGKIFGRKTATILYLRMHYCLKKMIS